MRRRNRCDDGPLQQAKTAVVPFDLGQVPVVAWEALSEANRTFQLNLDISVDHVSLETCNNLTQALKILQRDSSGDDGCPVNDAFWEWMALSTDDTQIPPVQANMFPTLSRTRALIIVLGHSLGCSDQDCVRLACTAGVTYLALLGLDGAVRFWGTLFQPVIFLQLLRLLVAPLSAAGDASRRRGQGSASANGIEELAVEEADVDNIEVEDSAGGDLPIVPVEEARSLLEILVNFLRQSNINLYQNSPEVVAMLVSRLGSLLSRPLEESVASSAAQGLAALVAGAAQVAPSELRRIATSVIRSLLPAVVMNQDTLNLPYIPPKLSQHVRLVGLDLLFGIIKNHPALLTRVSPQSSVREDGQSQSGMDDPVLAALQVMCVSCPERAEFRAAGADSFARVLVAVAAVGHSSPDEGCRADLGRRASDFVKRALTFLENLLACDRAGWRMMAAEAAAAALLRSEELTDSGATRAEFDAKLLVPLVRHCRDLAPTVRGRALGGVATAILSLTSYPEGMNLLREAMLSKQQSPIVDFSGLFRAASMDEKAVTRRAGLAFFDTCLQVMQSLKIDRASFDRFFDFSLLDRLAADESVLVRKATISSMSLLVREYPSEAVSSMWVNHVLPLALDPEASVAEKAFTDIDTVLLAPLSSSADDSSDGLRERHLSSMLRAIQKNSETVEYLKRVLGCLARRRQGTSPQVLASSLIKLLRRTLKWPLSEWPVVMWAMIEELALIKAVPGSACDFVLEAWESLELADQKPSALNTQVLRTLEHMIHNVMLPHTKLGALQESLRTKVSSLAIDAEEIRSALRVLSELEGVYKFAKGTTPAKWRMALARSLDTYLCAHVNTVAAAPDTEMCRCLFTLGELVLTDSSVAGAISGGAVAAVQAIASNTVQRETTPVMIDSSIRGHAFAALGKLCLQRDELAKKSVELFVLHLNAREHFTIRNNVLIILKDLCERYTSLVDRFVACMADLLRDPHELLRKQSVMVLASLLSENYIKFRGSIVHRFVYVLSDPCASVRSLVECTFTRILHPRNPALFANNFVDVVCGLNGWTGHPAFQSAADNKEFNHLKAPKRRTDIYRFMLSLLTNEQKFSVCSQMVTSFLTPFVEIENRIELPRAAGGPCGQSLHDVLSILVCKEMRICFSPKQASQEDEADLSGTAGNQPGAEAARSALTGMFKRVMCEHVVPVLVQLKNLMEEQHSPFLGRLRRCLCEILRDFKEDLQEILPNDPQLAGELAFDFANSSDVGDAKAPPESVSIAETGAAAKGKRPPILQKKSVCKATLNAVVRAGGKRRRSLMSEMGSNANIDSSQESLASASASPGSVRSTKISRCSRPVPEVQMENAIANKGVTPESSRIQLQTKALSPQIDDPPGKRPRMQKLSAKPPSVSTPVRKTIDNNANLESQQVPTPQSARSSGGGNGLLGMLARLRSTPQQSV